MKLILQEQEAKLRANFDQGCSLPHTWKWDPVPVLKLFTPWANATWLLTELTPDRIGFGLCDLGLGEPELGYVSLAELESIRGPGGLRVERDRHWTGRDLALSVWAEHASKLRYIPNRIDTDIVHGQTG